ncbi:DUF488 domain-containing protein [Salinimicrobium sediminilitoris]|uniref:DUF488 domain-containing protein n=1 Tax=Salinimicrobium sediminilitoris TaxID=2876715 RepID=UPI001E4FC36E|nr:DUF488 domain-containing protein [Salinimicrobium sediminilitoris]MCC8360127.1 DUF488 domain-containing protein [Salinimicrobium sediminilitoris]
MPPQHQIWTIGHSTHPLEEFLEWLHSHKIEVLVDIRRYPGSRKFPHFNLEALADSLPKNDILYNHFENLGGRRKAKPDSVNQVWRHPSFRGYADYMETPEFKSTVDELKAIATEMRTAIMCSEAVWWSCHRSMVADQLKADGWKVLHIMAQNKITEHPYTKPAKIENGKLDYRD